MSKYGQYKTNINRILDLKLDGESIREIFDKNKKHNSHYKISKGFLYTDDLDLLKLAHKIEAFYDTSESFPYWAIRLKFESDEGKICITQEPRELKSDFKFDNEIIQIDNNNKDYIKHCMIAEKYDEYTHIIRDELEEKYFKNGFLKTEYKAELQNNPEFIFALLEKGFYVFEDCESGVLRIR